jgi:hypothetical protein
MAIRVSADAAQLRELGFDKPRMSAESDNESGSINHSPHTTGRRISIEIDSDKPRIGNGSMVTPKLPSPLI